MKRKLYIEIDVDWEDYEDVSDELMFEDVAEDWTEKDGVSITLGVPLKEPFPGFWKRLESFVGNIQVNDPMSEEEKDMIINICKENEL